MSRMIRAASATLLVAMLAMAVVPMRALAHETRDMAGGKFQMVVGWIVEPALEGQKNGVDLRVRLPGTPPTPVLGVEKTPQVEMTHVGTNKSVTKPLRTIFNDPGHYTVDVLPTQQGQWKFRFFGTVDGTQVNETFTSGERWGNIEPISEVTFPDAPASTRALDGAIADAQASADDAAAAAASARMMAVVAIGVAVVFGGAAVGLALRRR